MKYYNMHEAKEIDFAIDYLKEVRVKWIAEIRAREKDMPDGVINDVVNKLASGLVTVETEIRAELKERLKEL